MAFDELPSTATLKAQPFQAHVSDQELNDFKQLLKLSKIGPKTYENLKTDRYFGISRDWLTEAKQHWETKFDWRKTEDRINSFPNWTTKIEYEGNEFSVHFVALFSKKADAVPLLLSHGWPGSILEFLDALDILRNKYTPETLPFQVIVPSLPGYGYSSGPPLDRDFTTEDMSAILDKLMVGLGYADGYIAQGGDIGSFVSRILAVSSPHCLGAHLNLCIGINDHSEDARSSLSSSERNALARADDFELLGNAYARMHGTRPATIGLTLSTSPLALLTWISEKFLVWTDTDPSFTEILDSVTLYWFTDSFPRAIYPYRQFFGPVPSFFHNEDKWYISKPFGYSWFPEELSPMPVEWVKKTGNLVWSKSHEEGGGHFAAMEKPKVFVKDMEEFVEKSWGIMKKEKK